MCTENPKSPWYKHGVSSSVYNWHVIGQVALPVKGLLTFMCKMGGMFLKQKEEGETDRKTERKKNKETHLSKLYYGSQSEPCLPQSHHWDAIWIRLGQEAYMLKHPAQRTVSLTLRITENTSACPTPHYSDLPLSLSLSPSHPLLLHLALPFASSRSFSWSPLERTHTHTHTHTLAHTPILITAILIVQEVEAIAFFLVISITPLLCQLSASSKIIPIYPTGCLHKRCRLSDSLRGMTDSSIPFIQRKLDSSTTA